MNILSKFSNIGHSIFFRIYAGLVCTCVSVAFLAYLLLTNINDYRAKKYRENMATGAFLLVAEGVARQNDAFARKNWLSDASQLFDAEFKVMPTNSVKFSNDDLERIKHYKAVVKYSKADEYADIYQKIPQENNIITVRLQKITEQQVKAMGIFLLDDLAYFPGKELERLAVLQAYFNYPLKFTQLKNLELDGDQINRLRRKEIVLLLRDSTRAEKSAISVIIPNINHDEVIIMGPVPLFNWAPLKLIVTLTLGSLLLISAGVYGLIFPLERRLRSVQTGVKEVRSGNLSAKVPVIGTDEVGELASSFNGMTEHIKRLIDTQREMTRAVSHELRTPVARIRFAVDMLADTDDAQSRMNQLVNIDKDIESLDVLIDEILTYAKLEEGSPRLDIETINLYDLVQQIVNETNALGKDVQVVMGDVNTRIQVVADRRYLHRVLQNLAGNATRYANSTIKINAGIEKKQAYIHVEDDGPGIPEADREKVFKPFARLDDSRTRASGGYGLGLSIVSRIAFWFDGHMRVDKSPALGGARFSMFWPAKALQSKYDKEDG